MTTLEIGDTAPEFKAIDQNETTQKLTDYQGQWIILYFYPKAMTPGCTTQACDLRDATAELAKYQAISIGISSDKPARLKKFETKENLNFPLLSDEDHRIAEAYGAWQEKQLYGRTYMGVNRMTFIIDPTGKVAHIIPKVRAKNHLGDVLNILKDIT